MKGVLVISHGSSNASWVEQVDQCINQVNIDVPIQVSFLEMVKGRKIVDGIRQLEAQGVTEIIAIPLFVSSGSTHIEEIHYLLGLTASPRIKVNTKPLDFHSSIELVSPMNDHSLIVDILVERAEAILTDRILLVGHGSDLPWFQAEWEQVAENIATKLQTRLPVESVSYAFTLPDNLRVRLEAELEQGSVFILPLFLSEGYFTKKKIPERLEGLSYHYQGKTYLPHPNVARWVEAVAKEKLCSESLLSMSDK